MNKKELKELVCREIDKNKEKIIGIGQKIFENPELGYKEFKTAKVVESVFDELNLKYENELAMTGVKSLVKRQK